MSQAAAFDSTPRGGKRASRRSILGGAALAVTAAASAGAVAVVGSMGPVGPDDELIALCNRYVSIELGRKALYDGPDAIPDDEEVHAAAAPFYEQLNGLIKQMERLTAKTPEGVLARARALAAENGDFGCSFDYDETPPGQLLAMLLRDAAAMGAGA